MSAEQREKFLAEACQGDSVLYAEIASLLSYRLAFFAVAFCVLAAAAWQLVTARQAGARRVT